MRLLIATLAAVALLQSTPLSADADAHPVSRLQAAMLWSYAHDNAYTAALQDGTVAYGVSECRLTRTSGVCRAWRSALTGYGYGRAEWQLRARMSHGRVLGVTAGAERWTPTSKLHALDGYTTAPMNGKRRTLSSGEPAGEDGKRLRCRITERYTIRSVAGVVTEIIVEDWKSCAPAQAKRRGIQ